MKTTTIKQHIERLTSKQPAIDILAIDFHNKEQRDSLEIDDNEIEDIKAYQRVYRLFPHNSRKLTRSSLSAESACYVLLEKGFHSAHAIAAMPLWEFLEQHLHDLGNDDHLAREIHHRATQVKAKVKHLVANIRDIAGSSHYRSTLFANTDPALIDYIESIPSYQDLFGTLDYLKCDPCASIFGPAAYFLDIMRITDRYITGPCKQISEAFKLPVRRPDLFSMKLTCHNTNNPIPYVQLVNEIIEEKLNKDYGKDIFEVLAQAVYPFNLPFNLPLTRINTYLDKLNLPLISIAKSLLAGDPAAYDYTTVELARTALGMSPQTFDDLTSVQATDPGIGIHYGFDLISNHLPFEGPGTITFKTGEKTADDPDFQSALAEGTRIKAGKQVRTVTKLVAANKIEVDDAWTTDSEPSQKYTVYREEDLTVMDVFTYRTGLSFDNLQDLFTQGLTSAEIAAGMADKFYINDTGEGLPALNISQDYGGDVSDPVTTITGLSWKRLDRLSRFIRLSRIVAIDFATLDWLMKATGANDIIPAFMMRLASLRQIAANSNLTLPELASFLYVIKNNGKNLPSDQNLFDSIYNNKTLLRGTDPYTTKTPIPFDPARPLTWMPGVPASWIATEGTAQSATDTTIVLNYTIPPDTVLEGFMITIVGGQGKGQQKVIKQFNGVDKTATIYDKWDVNPGGGSTYEITMAPGLLDRLSAALKIKQADLNSWLGPYLQSGVLANKPLKLTLDTLTWLWRLAIIPSRFRMPAENYLVLRKLLSLKSEPSKDPYDGLREIQTIISGIERWKATGLTVFELDYILYNVQNRYLRIAYSPAKVPLFLKSLTQSAKEIALSVSTFKQAGFSDDEADEIYSELAKANLIDKQGILLLNETAFRKAAAVSPVEKKYFFKTGVVSEKESETVFDEFHEQHPMFLSEPKDDKSYLEPDYRRQAPFNFLFAGVDNAAAKRLYVQAKMDELLDKAEYILYAPLLTVKNTGFENQVTPIDLIRSKAAFDALISNKVLDTAADKQSGILAPGFTDKTKLDYLFTSAASGQTKLVISYIGSTRTATLDTAWSTLPDAFSYYKIIQVVNESTTSIIVSGYVMGWSSNTVILGPEAADLDNVYDNLSIVLFTDPDREQRIGFVRNYLLDKQSKIAGIQQIMTNALNAQENLAFQAMSDLLGLPVDNIQSLLPFATGKYHLLYILSELLSTTGDIPPANIFTLLQRLSAISLLAGKLSMGIALLNAIARKPNQYGIASVDTLTFNDIYLLQQIKSFITDNSTTETALIDYLDISLQLKDESERITALSNLAGWAPEQISLVSQYLSKQNFGWQGIHTIPGLLRLSVPMNIIQSFACDGNFLIQLAGVADDQAANATFSWLASRYTEQEFVTIGDQLNRTIEVSKRDALLGFTIWYFGKNTDTQHIKHPSDLFQYLLIDVEMSGCDTTSKISQGINSVQLYMQRVRMGLETGANTDMIRDKWWDWISSYRMWEVNRKVFLYPENYIDPSLRRSASPEFRTLIDNLMQSPPTDDQIRETYLKYFEDIDTLSSLVHVAGYKVKEEMREGNQVDELSYIVARTNTTPYNYYVRSFTRSHIPGKPGEDPKERIAWGVWEPIKVTIKSATVVPVYSFDRLFLFWNEITANKDSAVVENKDSKTISETNSSWHATLKYTFLTATGEWVAAQELQSSPPVRIMPGNYNIFKENKNYLADIYGHKQQYWTQPYAQNITRGLPGTGNLSFASGTDVAQCEKVPIKRQLEVGDQIWAAGQLNRLSSIDENNQKLFFDDKWLVTASYTPFKIIPKNKEKTSFSPYEGEGTVSIKQGTKIVEGKNTKFMVDFQVGDSIQVSGETRTVESRRDDKYMTVDREWTVQDTIKGMGQVYISDWDTRVTGYNNSTRFSTQVARGNILIVPIGSGQERTIIDVKGNYELYVDKKFDTGEEGWWGEYYIRTVDRPYTVIPRMDGTEKLIVFFGPDLDIQLAPSPQPVPSDPNDGDNPFISARINFNEGVHSAVELVKAVKDGIGNTTKGLVAGEKALILGADLQQSGSRFVALDYNTAIAETSLPVRAYLDRENERLSFANGDNILLNTYWGNSVPASNANQPASNTGFPVLYNITGETASLLGIGNQVGWYLFNNTDEAFLVTLVDTDTRAMNNGAIVKPFWQPGTTNDQRIDFGTYTVSKIKVEDMKFRATRLGTTVINTLKQRLFIGGVDLLLDLDSQYLPEIPFDKFYQIPKGPPPPNLDTKYLPLSTMDFDGAFGPYFWEIFYHAPLLVADRLKINRNFTEAKRWYEYIFNPTARKSERDDHPSDRFWRFRPFRTMDIPTLKQVLENNFEITVYNDDPFNPDAIASLRISAYAKAAVMKYIDDLIQWGDELFSLDTRESITQATNLYVMASDLLGPRPQEKGKAPVPAPRSFDEIKAEYPGGIPQFLVEAENSVFLEGAAGGTRFTDVPVNDIDSYFCIPENEEFMVYWDTVEDRLYKIRHCMNIQGVERQLAMFAPALDPRSVIQAYGSAGGALPGAALIAGPVPDHRYSYLSSQAKSIVNDVMQLGSSLLSALEKKDGEALSVLQLTQATQILNMTTVLKEQQVEITALQTQGLIASLNSAIERKSYYSDLITEGLISEEKLQVGMMIAAGVASTVAGVLNTVSAIGYAVPQVGSPFAMTYGGQQIGASFQAAAGAADIFATIFRTISEVSGFYANHVRRMQEWGLQEKLASFDQQQFNAQINSSQIQQKGAEQELQIHLKQIEQNEKLELFYKDKFTSEALYQWIAGRLAITYYQAYSVAYEMAVKTQRAFQYEHRTVKNFISPGSWDNLHKGLLAGESLLLAINQMDTMSVNEGARKLEIRKTISLRTHDPFAFLAFVKTGETVFDFPEIMFDTDYPGHYRRRIKTVAVTIPALLGPYQNIHATLTQVANRMILKPDVDAVRFLLGDEVEVAAGVIEHNVRTNQRIALSVGVGDAGLFDNDPNGPLYLPFEQTGAVSSWKLSMPLQHNPIDYSSVSDVLIELSYTAVDGGDSFRKQVASLPQLNQRSWSPLIQAADQYSTDWYSFMHNPVENDVQSLKMKIGHLQMLNVKKAEIGAIYFRLVVPSDIKTTSKNSYISITLGDNDPIQVALSATNSFYYLLDLPIELKEDNLSVSIDFNLKPDYTPPSLKDGNRLKEKAVQNMDIIFFVRGEV
jgi:hypothetical protein